MPCVLLNPAALATRLMLQPFTSSLTLSNARDCLLEIVNLNIEGLQYVCAGELVALQALTNVLNYLKMQQVDVTKLTETFGVAKVKDMLKDIVNSCYESVLEKPKTILCLSVPVALQQSLSLVLMSPSTRVTFGLGSCPSMHISRKRFTPIPHFSMASISPTWLHHPSLSFSVHKACVELIYNRAVSPRFSEVLRKDWPIPNTPVWLSTPLKQSTKPNVPPEAATPSPTPVAAAPAVVTPPLVPTAAAGPATSIEDAPSRAVDIFAAIVSQKLKKQLNEFPLSGKFPSAPDKDEELPLCGAWCCPWIWPLRQPWQVHRWSRVACHRKMPGGFNISSATAHLSKAWGLGPQRADAVTVLLVATTMEPSKRLGFEAEGQVWFDAVAQVYANIEEFLKFQAEQDEFTQQRINLYSRYLKRDPRKGEILYNKERASSAELQAPLYSIGPKHGDTYIDGIQLIFDVFKVRLFDSSWNWVRQDALAFYDILFGRFSTVDREITARCIAIMNRADPDLLKFMDLWLIDVALLRPPLYKMSLSLLHLTEISKKGEIVYSEVNRENVHKLEAYVEEMCSADQISGSVNIQKIQDDVVKLWNVVRSRPEISEEQKNRIKVLYDGVVRSLRKVPDNRRRPGVPRTRPSLSWPQLSSITSVSADKIPLLPRKRRMGTQWEYDSNLTGVYCSVLHKIATSGSTLKDKNALITGVGRAPFASRFSKGIVQRFGTHGSALTVVPFNQGSKQDVEALVDYIYMTLGVDLYYIIAFAAVRENGREIDVLTSMNLRTLRLSPTQVVLPLSPRHGPFGDDGLNSDFKISIEALFNRWSSEAGVNIFAFWTRGTGLMDQSNVAAQEIETRGVRTFSAKEMAFNILGLMHPILFSITQVKPTRGDLSGGFDRIADMTSRIRFKELDFAAPELVSATFVNSAQQTFAMSSRAQDVPASVTHVIVCVAHGLYQLAHVFHRRAAGVVHERRSLDVKIPGGAQVARAQANRAPRREMQARLGECRTVSSGEQWGGGKGASGKGSKADGKAGMLAVSSQAGACVGAPEQASGQAEQAGRPRWACGKVGRQAWKDARQY
ncbi:hypothetical protein BC827DRAFT_1154089 [Russula dissimulans]|nr:hypothetical protein BC827DRAFT_1154089 [Russula dissimulans]